jgi:hypothetical protein
MQAEPPALPGQLDMWWHSLAVTVTITVTVADDRVLITVTFWKLSR